MFSLSMPSMRPAQRVLSLRCFLILWLAIAMPTFAQVDYQLYEDFPRGPVGGGVGYEGAVSIDPSFTQVTTLAALRAALANPSETRIFIPSHVELQVDSVLEITTPGLILTGDRGTFGLKGRASEGALLRLMNISYKDNNVLFDVKADHVRISGLRLTTESVEPSSVGIRITADPDLSLELEVDNNELFQFGYGAVHLNGHRQPEKSRVTSSVHHNHIHHNNKSGLGYGTVLAYMNPSATLAYNHYQENRHSVAASGHVDEWYTAAYNLTDGNSISSEYDMHGFSDYSKRDCAALQGCHPFSSCNHAGTEIVLLNNAAIDVPYFFGIRGIAGQGAYVTRNFYDAPDFFRLWRTWTYTSEYGPCPLSPPADASIDLPASQWSANHLHVWNNNLNPHGRYVHYVSWSGTHNWTPLFFNPYEQGQTAVGDFNGDGVDDIFYADGNTWWISWNGVTPWEVLNTSGYTTDQLGFGDFNGDGRTDVFLGTGSQWRVSWSGTSSWANLASSTTTADQLAFEDFNGDGRTDVFFGTGSQWQVSWSGTSSWSHLATSGTTVSQLGFGDFNGDGRADVFYGTGSQWQVSWSGTSSWTNLATSAYVVSQLAFEDFNGDGRTDVFLGDGSLWRVSWGGASSWQTLASSVYGTSDLFFGDFNGDEKVDVLRERAF